MSPLAAASMVVLGMILGITMVFSHPDPFIFIKPETLIAHHVARYDAANGKLIWNDTNEEVK